MTLSDYIKQAGIAESAALFGVSESTVKAWRWGWRKPRPAAANNIVMVTGGEVTLADIYAHRPAPSKPEVA